jgi:outer membrane protein OmpA-like peptidoglycan-associated protein
MWKFTQFADEFDRVTEKADQLVLKGADEDVDRWWGVRVAHAANYAANRVESFVVGGYVDVLRLGDGIFKEGGWRGWAHDGLRLLQILPIGKVSKLIGRSVRRANRIRRAVAISERPGEKICGWVSMKQALIQTGVKHAATLDDVIEAARGIALKDSIGLFASEMAEILRNAGARVTTLLGDAERMAFQDLEALVRRQKGGVVMFNLNFENVLRAPGEAAIVGHSLFAYLNDLGQFRMVDRSGMLRALSDIEQFYPGITKGYIKGAFHMADALVVRVLDELSRGPVWKIAFEIRSLFLGDKDDLDALFWQITQQLEENLPRPDEMPVRISPTDDSFTWIVGGPRDPQDPDYLELEFHSNQSKFEPKQVMVLERAWAKIRERLNPSRQQTVIITGFSDNVGNDALNKHISLKRAEAVAKWFLDRGHLRRDPRTGKGNLRTQGLGRETPRASNGTAGGRAHNRRVEIVLYNRT